MLKGENISFRYSADKPWILQNVSLEIKPGEVVGLSGPSGQGKTTLAKILAGYLRPNSGQISLDGKRLPSNGYCPVQLIFQHPELAINPRWRIGEVLTEAYTPSTSLLHSLNLEESWLTRWPHELSGGELQRVAVARALSPHTRYLIADEMTAMLDAVTQAQIWQAVLAFAQQQQVGLLVVSHETALINQICDRVVDMAVVANR